MNEVQQLIKLKNQDRPYQSSGPKVITDMDTFPYPRFYRGRYESEIPVILEREAGWRKRCDNNYVYTPERVELPYPNHCFQSAVTTVYPCRPEYERKYSDKKEMDIQLYNSRVNEYR
jgi:hypothetical protein